MTITNIKQKALKAINYLNFFKKKQYYFSVAAIFKNEAPYLKEWIEHYLQREVDHIYLINDNSTDNYLEVLKPYKNKITLFELNETLEDVSQRQTICYDKFFLPIRDQTKWLLVCDIDEYVWSPRYKKLKHACKELENSNIDAVAIPMMLFGSNNYKKQPMSIVQSFNKRCEVDEKFREFLHYSNQYKIIALASKIQKFGVHKHILDGDCFYLNSLNLETDLFRLNHYRTQSEEKWINNLKKTDVNNYIPLHSAYTSLHFGKEIQVNEYNNYRTVDLFKSYNKWQNIIEDNELINQNKNFLK